MSNTFLYVKLAKLLNSLGFKEVPSKGFHHVFEHKETDSIVILPNSKEVPAHHLVALRRTAVDRGIVSEEDFDDLVFENHVKSR